MEDEKSPGETVTRKKRYEPTDDDYELTRVSFDRAENGIVVSCGWQLKDKVRDKMKKSSDIGYCGEYYPDEKHVFQKQSEAKAFVMKELDSLWPGDED